MTPKRIVAELEGRLDAMIADLHALVEKESPSESPVALRACAETLAEMGTASIGSPPEILVNDEVPHVLWRGAGPVRVLILAHYDTVWPLGTLAERPFTVEDGHARGPGVFDMKGGLVQALHALAVIGAEGIALLATGDEETGSHTSKDLILEIAAESEAVLVAEPSEGGALKVARKGILRQEIILEGRAAHAGLEPHAGVSTTEALVPVLSRLLQLGDEAGSTTVTPTTVVSGHTINVVPDRAAIGVDCRAWTRDELDRVADGIQEAAASSAALGHRVIDLVRRDPLPPEASKELFEVASEAADELGWKLDGVRSGGCSDGNLTAGAGVPTLDGLGAVGDGAHARHEYLVITEMPRRAALVGSLVERVRSRRLDSDDD